MQHKLYIDGIRGIAVLAVIFFHANYNFFKGGFLGVDLFFILSGFLIIASISHNIENNKFSFVMYFKKRFFRIIPAAFTTILIILALGLLVLFPEELIDLYKNIYYILTIQSNALAAQTIDYFGMGVEYKPLVHYWSLSIELQFYIFFPLLIYIFIKYKYEKTLLFFLLLILIVSITYATINNSFSHNENYFSTFMRLWEFSLGASTFLISKIYNHSLDKYVYNKVFPILGIIFIFISLVMFDKTFNVPGVSTLIPTIGVVLILLFTNDNSNIGKILSIYPLRKIGIISYSLYLIHQPIFAFYRTIRDRDFYFYESILLIIFTFIVAYILWKFVERPFQNKNQKHMNYKILFILFFIVGLIFLSKYEMSKKPSDYVIEPNINKLLSYRYDNNPRVKECRVDNRVITPENACKYGTDMNLSTIVLWGDSHMDQIAVPLAKELNKFDSNVIEFAIAGCPPITDIDIKNKERKCYENSKKILNYILTHNEYKDIVLFAYWNYYTNNQIINDDTLEFSFQKMIEILYKHGKRIHIIYPTPKMNVNPPLHKARLEKLFLDNNFIIKISQEDYRKQSYKATTLLDSLPRKYNINKIYISELLKENNFYIANNNDSIFYRDDNHLSTSAGGDRIAPSIAKQIKKYIMDSIK